MAHQRKVLRRRWSVLLPGGMTLAATVCNTTPNMAPWALWIAKGECEYLVDLTDLLHPEYDVGLTGLTWYKGKLYLAVQSGVNPRILVFDRHLECVDTIMHPDFNDLHSLSISNGSLLVVSTGSQSVFAVDLRDRGTTTLFRTDQKIHANSVVQDASGLLVCCQSARHLFSMASQGGVLDITNQRVIVDGLGYPHSLLASGSKFIVLDSLGERVIRFDRSSVVQQQAVPGFLRGMAAGAGCLFVAGSVSRIISRKHPQPVTARATWEALGERVCIHELDGKTLTLRRTHFPLVAGFEIYEILVLEGNDTVCSPSGRLRTITQYALARAFYEAAKTAAIGGP